MPLHDKDSVRAYLEDEVYASVDLSVSMPKYNFPNTEQDPRHAYSVVHDELMLDGNSRQNLATFCQTWSEPEVHKLMDECMDKNIIDKDEYPQTAAIEGRCVRMLADLWNSPHAANSVGCSTTGSSEAAMLGGMAMKRSWEAKRKAAGNPVDKPSLVTGPVQICWHKFTRYWDIEHREIPMEQGRLLMTPEEVLSRCDENTIGVVPTLGVTFTCQYEPVSYREIHTACYDTANYISGEIEKLGLFDIIYNGQMDGGIPALCWKMKDGVDPGFSLYDLADRLRGRGWQVPAYSLPANVQHLSIQRILVRHGVSRDLGSLLIADIKRALNYFKQHPVYKSMTADEASDFHH